MDFQNNQQQPSTPSPTPAAQAPAAPNPAEINQEQLEQKATNLVKETKKQPNLKPWLLLLFAGLLICVGVGYFYYQKFNQVTKEKLVTPTSFPTPSVEVEDPLLNQLETQNSSDDIEAIEKDLLDTDLSGLDQELDQIEKELITP